MITLRNLDETVPVKCNTDEAEVFGNVKYAESLPYPRLGLTEPHEGVAVIVGGGPSMRPLLPMIQAHYKQGHSIFALNGATKFLKTVDVVPDHFVMVDSREDNWAFIDVARHYLLASQCHPMVFKAVTSKNITIWNPNFPGIKDHIEHVGALIGGGTTVGLMALHIAYAMGYRTIHAYGLDSSYKEDDGHAYAQKLNDGDERFKVRAGGKEFTTCAWMLRQAMEFQESVRQLAEDDTVIHIHGEGLLPTIAQEMANPKPLTVLTVYSPSKNYKPDSVRRLKQAVAENLSIPHNFVCLTNHVIEGVDCIPLELGFDAWWAKPEIFRPDLPFERVLFLDLSVIVTGFLDEMASQEGVVITKDWYFGGPSQSVLLYDVGDFTPTWEAFKAEPHKFIDIGNRCEAPDFYDQVLMNRTPVPDMRYWQDVLLDHLVSYKVHCLEGLPTNARVVKFHGVPKLQDLPLGHWAWKYVA